MAMSILQVFAGKRMLNLDTHILLFALSKGLTTQERSLLSKHRWSISAIVLWEIAKLRQLGRIDVDLRDPTVLEVLGQVRIWPIDLALCKRLDELDFRSDPADELIAATSLVHRVPLVTRDRTIRRSKVVPLANASTF